MKKLETNWSSGMKLENKEYFAHAIYNPNKPMVSFEEAMATGKEQNPTTMFSEDKELKKLPEGFEKSKLIGKFKKEN